MTIPPPEQPNKTENLPDNEPDNAAINLAALREKAGFSLDDMSRHLKLNRDLLQRLERGETEFLGAAAYVKGYLRNYAKILGVDAQEVISGYPIPDEKTPHINTRYAIATAPGHHRSSGNFLGYLLGTIVVAAFAWGIWYMMSQGNVNDRGLEVKLGQADSTGAQSDPARNGAFHYSSLLPSPDTASDKAGLQPVVSPEAKEPVMPTHHNAAPLESLGAEPTDDGVNGNDAIKPSDQNRLQSEETPGDIVDVLLELSQSAWVSIRAGDGNRLEHNLLAAGEYRYQGRVPLHFRLGNASSVRVLVNDQEFALDSFIRKDIADFEWPAALAHTAGQ